MSFGNSLKMFSGIQQALILALMMVSVFSLFYFDIDITYKIGIGVFAFTVIFLMTLATQILRQQKEEKQQAQR
jgi:4-hydroxybenzoate polyprenyltransferase